MARRWSAKPARFSAPHCASSRIATRSCHSGARVFARTRNPAVVCNVWIPGSRASLAPRNDGGLLRRLLDRRDAGQDDLDLRAAARLRIEVEAAAQPVGDDAVDDVQPEPGAA